MTEHDIQNNIRVAVSQMGGVPFRCNVGAAWVGTRAIPMGDGAMMITNARRFDTGLPRGFSDLFCVLPGGRVAFVECKTDSGRLRPEQAQFLEQMRALGCIAGVARGIEDVYKLLGYQDIAGGMI